MRNIIWTTSSFLVPSIIIFLLFLSFFLYPREYPLINGGGSIGQICGDPPPGYPTVRAPSYAITSTYQIDGDGNRGGFLDSVLTGSETTYEMIKTSVPIQEIEEDWFHFIGEPATYIDTLAGRRKVLWPSGISGKYTITNGAEKADVLFMDYGIIFLQHLEVNGDLKTVTINGVEMPLVDIYKETAKPQIDPRIFTCSELGETTDINIQGGGFSQVVIPPQNPSTDNQQLQLEYFVFNKSKPKVLYLTAGCKPAVYLYPPQKQLVNVKVFPEGYLTYTDPIYDSKTGWTVEANPDGKLSVVNQRISESVQQYPYLYYESKISDSVIEKPIKGWVVESGQLAVGSEQWFEPMEDKFNELLPKLGLNAVQTKDFIDYWEKALPYSPYYFVGVIDQKNVDQIERLEITPKPDYVNRVRIYFERLDTPKVVEAPELSAVGFQLSAGVAEGRWQMADDSFRVVEWGGMVKNDPNHPFTCSQ